MFESVTTLRFFGDELEPDEVTARLGSPPTRSHRKGDLTTSGGARRAGGWLRSSARTSPADLDAQIREVLAPLTSDLSVWAELTARYQADVFCGLFLQESNEGFSISPATLRLAS